MLPCFVSCVALDFDVAVPLGDTCRSPSQLDMSQLVGETKTLLMCSKKNVAPPQLSDDAKELMMKLVTTTLTRFLLM